MKFFVSGNPRKNKTLTLLITTLWAFLLLFWIVNWLYYHFTFGLTIESLKLYFFGVPDFPEKISYDNLLTDLHVFFFTSFFLFFLSASLTNLVEFRFKNLLIVSGFLFLLGELVVSLTVPLIESLIPLKLLFFILFQITVLLLLLSFILKFYSLESYTAGRRGLILLVTLFAIFTLSFSLLNLFLFLKKLGFSPESVKSYFLGNEKTFTRPKSFSGILKIVYPHLLFIPLFSFTLAHFLPFTQRKVNHFFVLFLILIPLLEMVISFGIRYLSGELAILKVILLFISIYLYTTASLKLLSSIR